MNKFFAKIKRVYLQLPLHVRFGCFSMLFIQACFLYVIIHPQAQDSALKLGQFTVVMGFMVVALPSIAALDNAVSRFVVKQFWPFCALPISEWSTLFKQGNIEALRARLKEANFYERAVPPAAKLEVFVWVLTGAEKVLPAKISVLYLGSLLSGVMVPCEGVVIVAICLALWSRLPLGGSRGGGKRRHPQVLH